MTGARFESSAALLDLVSEAFRRVVDQWRQRDGAG